MQSGAAMNSVDIPRSTALCEEALSWATRSGDRLCEAHVLMVLASRYLMQIDCPRAAECAEQAMALNRHKSGSSYYVGLWVLGEAKRLLGDREAAEQAGTEFRLWSEHWGHPYWIACALEFHGKLARDRGEYAVARSCLAESLNLHWQGRSFDGLLRVPYLLAIFATLAAVEGRAEQATRLFGAADTIATALQTVFVGHNRFEFAPYRHAARQQLGEASYQAVYREGCSMTREQAVATALSL